ncbi:hypothetical protein ACWGJT_04815 [Streptomyces xantholiticus]
MRYDIVLTAAWLTGYVLTALANNEPARLAVPSTASPETTAGAKLARPRASWKPGRSCSRGGVAS